MTLIRILVRQRLVASFPSEFLITMASSKKNTLIVLSGGMDSVTMLYEYAPEIALAVNFYLWVEPQCP